MFDWETHQFILIPRHSSCRQWRAAPFGACLARRITKMAKHSNPVIRSLFISTVRLSLHRRICQNRHILFLCLIKHSFLFEIGACLFFLRIFTGSYRNPEGLKYNHLPKYLLHLPISLLIVFKYLL